MNSILIIGASNAGKSSTMSAVCKRLKPTKVFRLITDINNYKNSKLEEAEVGSIFNNTFIIEVQGKLILVCAGAPTEQGITILILIEICIKIKIEISFLLVSMRSFEKKVGFDTPKQLASKSNIVLTKRISRIEEKNYVETAEWKNRIKDISAMTLEYL
ncbi:hypothetical protein HRG84_02615 [Flavisolibacter sp. BT320]|nr:hypothetical protein [Flavisolibacter longurius]